MEKEIIFTYTKMPPTLSAQYDGRTAEIGISLVPEVMEADIKGRVLLHEERIKLAEDYLKTILFFPK